MATNPLMQSPFDKLADELDAQANAPLPGQEAVTQAPAMPDATQAAAPKTEAAKPADTPAPAEGKRTSKGDSYLPPAALRPLFDSAAKKYDVPVNVIMALAHQESRYNASSIGQPTEWGRAKGMLQYLDSTASGMGINPLDPEQAIGAAAKQIRERLDKGYSMEDAVKEHFAGPDRKKWGTKTAAYGREVMDKVNTIGGLIESGAEGAPASAKAAIPDGYKQITPEQATAIEAQRANGMSMGMPRGVYEQTFMANNPQASPGALAGAMAAWDQLHEAPRAPAKGTLALPTPEQFFQQKLDARLAGPKNGIVPPLPGQLRSEAPVVSDDGNFVRRFKDSGIQARGLAKGTLGMVGDASERNLGFGADLRDWGYDGYTKDMKVTQERASPNDDVTHVWAQAKNGDYSGVTDYLAGGAGYLSGQALEALAAGLAGAGIGSVVPGAGTVGGAVAGVAEKALVKKIIGSSIANRIAAITSEKVAGGMVEAEARQLAKQQIGKQIVGALAGTQAYNMTQELGTTYGEAREEKHGEQLTGGELGKAATFGTLAALTETVGDAFGIGQFFKAAPGAAAKQGLMAFAKAVGVKAGLGSAAEGTQELVQTYLERVGAGKSTWDEAAFKDYINSGVLGALGGASHGVVGGAVSNRDMLAPAQQATPLPSQLAPLPAEAAPAPSTGKPLTAAVENAAAQEQRVVVQSAEGGAAGTLKAYQEDGQGGFAAQIVGDDGQVYTITDQDGVQVTPVAPAAGPLTAAVEDVAAKQPAIEQVPMPAAPAYDPTKIKIDDEITRDKQAAGAAEPAAASQAESQNGPKLEPGERLVYIDPAELRRFAVHSAGTEVTPEREAANAETKASLQRDGFKPEFAPRLDIDRTNGRAKIADGNHRTNWAADLGMGPIPVIIRERTLSARVKTTDYAGEFDNAPDTAPAAPAPTTAPVEGPRQQAETKQIADMTDAELRTRLKYVTSQAKTTGWDKRMMEARREVEREINTRNKAAAEKEAEAAKTAPIATEYATQREANAGALALAERTNQLHEVVEADGKFNVQPITGESDGNAGANGDERGRGAGTVAGDGATVGVGSVPAGVPSGPGSGRGAGSAVEQGVPNADAGASAAAVEPVSLKNEYATQWFGSQDKAAAFIARKKIDATHRVEQTGRARFEIRPKVAEARPDGRQKALDAEAKLNAQIEVANQKAAARAAEKAAPATEQQAAPGVIDATETSGPPAPEPAPENSGNETGDVVRFGNQPVEAATESHEDTGADIPLAFYRKVKVQTEVMIEDEPGKTEMVEISADKALASVREDIGHLRALLNCLKG